MATFTFPRALSFLRRGLLHDAEAEARWSFEQKISMGVVHGPPWPLACLVDSLTELGDFQGADEALGQVAMDTTGPPEMLAWAFVVEARGRLRVAQGRIGEGIADLLEAGRRWERLCCNNAGVVRWRETAALALAQVGETEKARHLAAEQLELAQATGLPQVLGTATRVAGAVAPRADRLPLLRQAVNLLEQSPGPGRVRPSTCRLGRRHPTGRPPGGRPRPSPAGSPACPSRRRGPARQARPR